MSTAPIAQGPVDVNVRGAMQILVDCPSVKIHLRNTDGYCVCTKCRGSRHRTVADYYNSAAWYRGGLIAVTHQEWCPRAWVSVLEIPNVKVTG